VFQTAPGLTREETKEQERGKESVVAMAPMFPITREGCAVRLVEESMWWQDGETAGEWLARLRSVDRALLDHDQAEVLDNLCREAESDAQKKPARGKRNSTRKRKEG
jgi:hypothetical protein